jgi:hypothetical protein
MMMMVMKMIFGAIGGMNLAGETELLGGNLPRRHFVHHKIPHRISVNGCTSNNNIIKRYSYSCNRS